MVAVAACCGAYIQRRQLIEALSQKRELELELNSSRPIPFRWVAHQVGMATNQFAKDAEAVAIDYNPLRDRYTVQLNWTHLGVLKSIPVRFEPDGMGRYYGSVAAEPFGDVQLDAEGNERTVPLEIVIKDEVARQNDVSIKPFTNSNWKVRD